MNLKLLALFFLFSAFTALESKHCNKKQKLDAGNEEMKDEEMRDEEEEPECEKLLQNIFKQIYQNSS